MIKITNVYAEMTPNPQTMKFVADRMIVPSDGIAEYFSAGETKNSSDLAEKLFAFPFVKSVFITGNFITITKNDSISWDFITMELREFILNYVRNHEFAVQKFPEQKSSTEGEFPGIAGGTHSEPVTETDAKIIAILDEYVRPAVENDGGAIHFRSFNEGIVTVALRGSCSGCPSSAGTLKNGVETLMKQMLPEVREVVALGE